MFLCTSFALHFLRYVYKHHNDIQFKYPSQVVKVISGAKQHQSTLVLVTQIKFVHHDLYLIHAHQHAMQQAGRHWAL